MKSIKYLSAAVLMWVLAACQSDNAAYREDSNAVKIKATISGLAATSRVNSDADGSEWNNGDQIHVTNTTGISNKDAAAYGYVSASNTWTPQGSDYMVWTDGSNSFEAYYPYAADKTNSFSAFTLPQDQSSLEGGLYAADWMTATAITAKTSDNSITLTFKHEFAKVKVQITGYNNQYETPADVAITAPSFTLPTTPTVLTGKTVTVEESATAVKAYMVTDTENAKHTFSAIVMPGKYTAGDAFLNLTVDAKALTVNANTLLTTTGLEAGKSYTFTLTVGKDKLEIGNVTVEDWDTGTDIEGGEAGVVPPYEGREEEIDTSKNVWIVTNATITNSNFNSLARKLQAVAEADPTRRIKLTITAGNQDSSTIPSKVFNQCTALYSLDMPNMTSIPELMCCQCTYLKQINLPKVTSIGKSAFLGTALTSVTLPAVQTVDDNAFNDCKNLTLFDLPEVLEIGESVVSGCIKLTTIHLPKVQTVGHLSFTDCPISTIDLPEVTSIGNSAFYRCRQLTSISMPKVQTIGTGAFDYCLELKTVSLPDAITALQNNTFRSCNKLETIHASNLKTIGKNAFEKCYVLKSVDLSKVTEVPEYAFSKCTALTDIGTPQLTTVRQYAFSGCSALPTIDLTKVVTIENNALEGCASLTSVSLPNITEIPANLFYNCSGLKEFDMSKLTAIGDGAFFGCTSLTAIDLAIITEIGTGTFSNCTSLISINAPKLVHIKGSQTFAWCSALKSVNMPELIDAEYSTFLLGALTGTLNFPKLTNCVSASFQSCKFTSITLPNVIEVGPYCFANCDYLESINLPKATTFGYGAFRKATIMKTLTSITLGSPVVSFATKDMWSNIATEKITLTLSSAQKQMTLQETVYVPTEEDFTDWGEGKTFCGQTFKEIKQAPAEE